MNPDREIRIDAKLQNLPQEKLDELWRMRHPEDDGQVVRMVDICAAMPDFCGFSVSLSTLSNFYKWLRVKRRIDARATLADQLKAELAAKPDLDEDQIRRAGQRLFMADGILEKDARVFSAMVQIYQEERRLAQNDERLDLNRKRVSLDERRLVMLEAKAAKLDAAEAEVARIQGDAALTPEQRRAALLDHMDEFFGLKKK